ncbi:MAG: hypothetical protein RJA22_2698 [Verrucomicrobiota bacterium]|jgi:nucleoside-diphosphate-sugar epimerase
MASPSHVLVLGASGFLGTPLWRQLADEGARLTVLVHQHDPGGWPAGTRILRGDLASCDLGWCQSDPPQQVFHCARLRGRGVAGRALAAWRGARANRRWIQCLTRLPEPPRVVYASGSLVYGSRGEDWVEETTPLAPTSFARQYARAEEPWRQADPRRLPVVMARPGWVLGEGSWLEGFYLGPARREGAVPLYGEGRNWMTFIHREDCAALLRAAARHGIPGSAWNLAPAPPLRQADFVEALAGLLGLPVRRQPLESLRGRWDRALVEAFGSSIRLRSAHDIGLAAAGVRFPDTVSALRAVVAGHTGHTPPSTTARSG